MLRERILEPRGMKDTGFFVSASALHRLPEGYGTADATGERVVFDPAGEGSVFAKPPVFESGAGGLASTADDLLAFGEMMLGHGRRGQTRVLSRAAVTLMTTDQIAPAQKAAADFFPGFWESNGCGFGVSVTTRRDDSFKSPGRYGWDGGYGTTWYADPVEDVNGVLLTQRLIDSSIAPAVFTDFWTSACTALAG